ncbi:MAG: 23S rRNA (pseudouridine(1915)-N(3))-methyltransferase RlmH [Cocleimonas sp.]|nr:23S rRNA (pseudouridine(1915)-N(3))-methyltransferase RlmH [Cocleimonas sp.]
MRLYLLAVGTKMPTWVTQGYEEYAHRMPTKCKLILKEIPAEKRTKNSSIEKIQQKEATKLLNAIPNNCRVVALDGQGALWTTEKLACRLEDWMMSGQDIALLVGGADGLTKNVLATVNEHWSLSRLTFPHPLVRVMVAEQLYRAWSISENHPYHRGA